MNGIVFVVLDFVCIVQYFATSTYVLSRKIVFKQTTRFKTH